MHRRFLLTSFIVASDDAKFRIASEAYGTRLQNISFSFVGDSLEK